MRRSNNTRPALLSLFALLCVFASQQVAALPDDNQQPIQLSADSADMDEGKGRSIYRGDVEVIQGSIRLLADTVTVLQEGREPQEIIAVGNVRFSQQGPKGPIKGKSRRAEYLVNSEILTLIDDAWIDQAGDSMSSDRIIYDRVKHRVRGGAAAKGKQRVQMTLQAPGK